MRFEGRLKSWTDDRGFGFIEPDQGGQEIFVHIKAFPDGTGRPRAGQRLAFEVELGQQGKKRAKNVQFVSAPLRSRSPRTEAPAPWGLASTLAIPVFLAIFGWAWVRWQVPGWAALAYLGASVVCFLAYAFDKSAARRGRWRTPERTLLMLGLWGGWPGGLLAQQLLRHKSNKRSFRAAFWGSVLVNVAVFLALASRRFV